jgi:hypothetical protein
LSSAPKVILLDSNAYFRLARSIHPLLAGTFGDPPPNTLKVIEEVDREYSRNPRLKTKFHWLSGAEYVADRKSQTYHCRGKVATQVESSFSFLAAHANSQAMNLSRVDIRALAVGAARSIPVVSDDGNMGVLAQVFQITCWSTLQLLHLMVVEGRIDTDKVDEILEYWQHDKDLPAARSKLRKQYQNLFGAECPI